MRRSLYDQSICNLYLSIYAHVFPHRHLSIILDADGQAHLESIYLIISQQIADEQASLLTDVGGLPQSLVC